MFTLSWSHARVCSRCIVALLAFMSCSLAVRAFAQPAATIEGVLTKVWADPRPGSPGGLELFLLTVDDGRTFRLQAADLDARASGLINRRVRVTSTSADVLALPAAPVLEPTIAIESIELAPSASAFPGPPDAAVEASVFGTKKVIYLLVKFSDDAAVPHPPVFFTDMTNPDTPPAGEPFPSTINGFYKKTSWNQFSWVADVGGVGGVGAPGGWLTLPQPKSYYAPCTWASACFSTSTISNDALTLGRAQGIDFRNYDNINFVMSNDLDCCAWGGGYYSSVDGKSYGATWEPPWGQNVGTYAHEMGHSIGLPHSGWAYYAYDSPWDIMSSIQTLNGMNCGSYFSRNSSANATLTCSEPGTAYISAAKDFLGWIPPSNIVVAGTFSSMTVTLDSLSAPLGSAAKLIKICLPSLPCTGNSARFFTIEARTKGNGTTSQYDNNIPGEGIIIHDVLSNRGAISGSCFFNNQSGVAIPVDATPGDYNSVGCNTGGRTYPNYGLYNAQFTPGTTYTNSAYSFRVSVLSRSGSTYAVSISSSLAWRPQTTRSDFDGDGKADLSTYRPTTGGWSIRTSQGGFTSTSSYQWGATGDIPKVGDLDGDGKTDLIVYRPSTGQWFIRYSFKTYDAAQYGYFEWGAGGDMPIVGDFDGDGKTDIGVYRPTGYWYLRLSSVNYAVGAGNWIFQWGTTGDVPELGDFDGDGKMDITVFRPSTGQWFIRLSTYGYSQTLFGYFEWGATDDVPLVSDFDGDQRPDVAVYRPSTGYWYILNSSANYAVGVGNWIFQWGQLGDLPRPGDFDGDGKSDIVVFRPSTGQWFIRYSALSYDTGQSGTYTQGANGDISLPQP